MSGVLFGFGLALSDMLSPSRTMWFFDIAGNWDPTLLFVMIGALSVSIVGHAFLKMRHAPLFDTKWHFSWEKNWKIDTKLIVGSLMFGVGWWISGLCPGPALGNIVFFDPYVIGFLISMVTTMWIYTKYQK